MSQAKLQSPAPPIFSADGHEISVGMTLFGVDKNCRDRDLPKIEPLLVTQIDLGVRRYVRLRRNNGTEWPWSTSNTGPCAPGTQLLYAEFDAAKSVAVEVATSNIADYESAIERGIKSLDREKRDLAKSRKRLTEFKSKIAALRKTTKPKVTAK